MNEWMNERANEWMNEWMKLAKPQWLEYLITSHTSDVEYKRKELLVALWFVNGESCPKYGNPS